METLWSISTTIRESERIVGFLTTANELNGEKWDKNIQEKFQILLIKNRQYLNTDNTQSFSKLNNKQCKILRNKSINMTYEEAENIFKSKNYNDPPMRGRQSMSPLVKLGLVYIGIDKKIEITDAGNKLIYGKIEFSDFILDSLLKFQYPNPYEKGFKEWDTKPFINTLRLIKKVNELSKENKLKESGISKIEFGIFALSLKSYLSIDSVAKSLMKFRKEYKPLSDKDKIYYLENYTKEYLKDFKNPLKNIYEYTDNMIRYLRLTKYIYIRGKYSNIYIDLEPRRMIEIDAILDCDEGKSKNYNKVEWKKYMGTYGSYNLPFETIEKLTQIVIEIENEINNIENNLGICNSQNLIIPKTKDELKSFIEKRRKYRTKLQNIQIKYDYGNITKIDEVIDNLRNINNIKKNLFKKNLSIELEKWINIALNILNDSKIIKPNAPVGDDNEPIYTAPGGVPDIECYYESFNAICEVTMITSRDQWYNEGQPVMRHLREFEDKHLEKNNYCLFIAPKIHVDTLNTFYISVKYEYQGRKQKIIPITINQLLNILICIKSMAANMDKKINHCNIMELYEKCCNLSEISDSTCWLTHINTVLEKWIKNLTG